MRELPRRANTLLIVDDEPYNLSWVGEYLGSKGYQVEMATTVDEALEKLQVHRYRAMIVDLSIPFRSPHQVLGRADPILDRYPGLVVAEYARNRGHLDRQVIVYSVHDDPSVKDYTTRLGVTYLLKGRPRQFKEELDSVLEFDPLEWQDSAER